MLSPSLFLGSLLAVVAISCNDGERPPPENFASAARECSGCFHVIRDLEFVREIATIDDQLYVSDPDGARLLRIALATGSVHEVDKYVSAHYLFVTEGALYYASSVRGGAGVFKVTPPSDTPSLVASYPSETGTFLGVRGGVPHVLRRNVVRSVGLEGPIDETTYPEGATGFVMAETGALGWITADRSIALETSPDSEVELVTVSGRPSRLSFVAGEWYATGTSSEGQFAAWRLGSNPETIETGSLDRGKVVGLVGDALLFLAQDPDEVSKVAGSEATRLLRGGDVRFTFGDQPVAVHGTDVFVGGHGRANGQVYLVRGGS